MKNCDFKQNVKLFGFVFISSFFLVWIVYLLSLPGSFFDYFGTDTNIETIDGGEFLANVSFYNGIVDDTIYSTTGDDPQMILAVNNKQFKYIKVDISDLSPEPQIAQIFWGFADGGLSEQQSVIVTLVNGFNIFKISAQGTDIKTLRFDLSTGANVSMRIDSVQFITKLPIPKRSYFFAFCAALLLLIITLEIKSFRMAHYELILNWIERNRFIFFYSIAIFFVYSLWALITPFNGAPDEYMRFDVVRYIVQNGSLPNGGDPSIRNEIWGFSYAYRPYTPQIIGGFFVRLLKYFFANNYLFLYALRLPSILFGVLTTVFTYKIGRKMFAVKWAIVLTLLVSLWPENAMIASYMNSDSFALFTISVMIYSWVCGLKNNWDTKSCVLLAIGAGLCLLSYYNAFVFIMLSAILWLVSVICKKENRNECYVYLKRLFIMLGIVLVIGGWFYIRNAALYNGDFLGLKTASESGQLYAMDDFKPANRNNYSNLGKTLAAMLTETRWIGASARSFVATFGYMNITAPKSVYVFFCLVVCIGFIGTCVSALQAILKKKHNMVLIFCAVSLPIAVWLSAYYSWSIDFQPQGRYFLTALISLCLLTIYGFERLLFRFIRTERLAAILVLSGTVVMHILSFVSVFYFYYPTPTFSLG